MSGSAWGDSETRYFHALTPDRILDAVEASTGRRCTGRALALNSMENRVYELEVEPQETVEGDAEGSGRAPRRPAAEFLIAKFYRPGRWSEAQILEEHAFLAELQDHEIPVVAPLPFRDGATLHRLETGGLWYTVFPKCGGRAPDELGPEQLAQAGRLLARLHNVGAARKAPSRVVLTPETYGLANLRHLVDARILPDDVKPRYQALVEAICAAAAPLFAGVATHRIHGDCHLGNLLWGRSGLFFVDFDDMVTGPAVQDMWLLLPGRDDEARAQLEILLDAYQSMRPFDRGSLRLIEALRALRLVHFSAWIGRRWQDPAFQRAFPQFGTAKYWTDQLSDLSEQLAYVQDAPYW
jgi:Ser/Thr protein kinase RdoA (MazF antagonist)